jgi:hypothetical protein
LISLPSARSEDTSSIAYYGERNTLVCFWIKR